RAPSPQPTAERSPSKVHQTRGFASSADGPFMRDDASLVAVIDDDEATCRAVARVLAADCYRVRTYTTAREYLEEADAASPSCVLVDIRMPDLDGLSLFRTMRDGGGDIPAVFMTGSGHVPTVVEAMKE